MVATALCQKSHPDLMFLVAGGTIFVTEDDWYRGSSAEAKGSRGNSDDVVERHWVRLKEVTMIRAIFPRS